MNKTVKIESKANAKSIVEVIKALKPREAVDRKTFPQYYKDIENVLNVVYNVYREREKGTATKEAESEAMKQITAFLHTLGKANGKYISVCEKTTENGISSVLFDTLVYNSFKDRIYTKSATLAHYECEKKVASKAKAEAHEKLVNGKGTATAYKEAVAKYNEAVAKVEAERMKANAEAEATTKESNGKFAKFVTARLKAIINNRYALSTEEAEAIRKLHNKATKEKRKAEATKKSPTKTTAKSKKPEAVKEAPKPEAKATATKQEAEKKTA